ncbi:acetyl-CoA carboxylase biotin carboxyl carrier protein [Rhodospirillaceae bacterium KN72]|uniref:Biotin carboxyl carrier protein of acetyl-CoA carboxylase n=1 Tax=Pacificispira spongiicola TaxID=2729598 RepID=A0A7Y0DZ88_9PROT|nr:acetyl-CoA carboxylase biotin carboxyl carrier protein [Pacificispira spongiicola]NMM44323.1 acetyl-CoA carboxylase biotin carboxyl carrier protein [Pacificispira spongiicola]
MAKNSVDIELIEKLADLMEEKGLTELIVEEDDSKLRLSRGAVVAAAPVAAAPAPAAPAAVGAAPAAAPADAAKHPGAVTSPMVGTAYLAPQPGAANFISVGAKVAAGDTLLIIEAMKVMNQIPATKAGTVTEILVADGAPVEFGEALVIIE